MPDGTQAVATPAATPPASPPPAAPPSDAAPAAPPASPPPAGGGAPAPLGLDEGDGDGGEVKTPANWPENWREIMAGGDQKTLSYLKRYASPNNVTKALLGLRSKMDAGEIVRSKPDPKDEVALNEWRAQAGIPEKPEGYLEKIPDGLVIGEDDKPMVESFIKDMHGADAPPAYVHKALQWYNQVKEQNAQALAEADRTNRAQAEDALRSEWGPEYRANLNGARSLLKTHGSDELLNRFFSARMADGTPLGDDPETLKFLVSLDKQLNPHGTVPPPDSVAGKAMATEMETIKKAMSDSNSDYWKGPKDASGETQMQRRYRELVELEGARRR